MPQVAADPLARWITLLQCGHEARVPVELRPCQGQRRVVRPCQGQRRVVRPCQGQRRVVRVSAVCAVPAPGETGVQGELWGAAA
jgi:hypothetical protein